MAADRPNVVFLVAEQLRRDHLGCYGHPFSTSPAIDRLADSGVRFNHCYCPVAKCTPSRVAALSGRYPSAGGYMALSSRLRPEDPNIVRSFREAGYQTHLFRKNHQMEEETLAQSYDRFWAGADFSPESAHQYNESGSHPLYGALYRGRNDVDIEKTVDRQVARRVAEIIRETSDQPFFLWVSFWLAHPVFTCTEPYFSMFDRDQVPVPPVDDDPNKPDWLDFLRSGWGLDSADESMWRELVATYWGMIRELDTQIEIITQALQESGQAENTLVIFWGDHGEFAGDHQLVEKYDTAMYDCLVGTPLLMSGPELPRAEIRDTFVEAVDLLVTAADVCRVDIPPHMHGRSFLPCIEDAAMTHRESAFGWAGYDLGTLARGIPHVDEETPYAAKNDTALKHPLSMAPTAMVRTHQWKLIHRWRGQAELYDMQNDPQELRNLFGQTGYERVQQEMLTLLLERCLEAGTPVDPSKHLGTF